MKVFILALLWCCAVLAQPVSVTTYGAKCDGATDDQIALQAAFNAGGDITIPGTCNHSGPLIVGSNTRILCQGGTLVGTDQVLVAIEFYFASHSSAQGCNFIFPNATARQAAFSAAGVLVSASNDISVMGNSFAGTPGAHVIVTNSYNVHVRSNTGAGAFSNGSLTTHSSYQVDFQGNFFTGSGDADFEVTSYSADTSQVHDVIIANNSSVGNAGPGIINDGSVRVKILGNTVIRPAAHGIVCLGDAYASPNTPVDCQIEGNHINNANASGKGYQSIVIDSTAQALIEGNDIANGPGISLSASGSTYIDVVANHLYNILGAGINVPGDVSHVWVKDNSINTLTGGICISLGNKIAPVDYADIGGNSCDGIIGSSTVFGVIDIVGATHLSGTPNRIGVNSINAGPMRLADSPVQLPAAQIVTP